MTVPGSTPSLDNGGYTRGPWSRVDGRVVGPNGKQVLFSGHSGFAFAGLPEDNPDDALALAAPELLEALGEMLAIASVWAALDGGKNIDLDASDTVLAARAALNKALGK